VKELVAEKINQALRLSKGDAIEVAVTDSSNKTTRLERFTAEQEVLVNTVRVYYIENEMGFKNGYMAIFGET
jgi:hypothetical protein